MCCDAAFSRDEDEHGEPHAAPATLLGVAAAVGWGAQVIFLFLFNAYVGAFVFF